MVKCSKKGCDGFGVFTFTCRQIHWDGKQVGRRPPSTPPSFQSCFYLRVPCRVNKVFFFSPWLLKGIHVLYFGKSMDTWVTWVKVKALIQLQYSSESKKVQVLKCTSLKSKIFYFCKNEATHWCVSV